jgi:hypothetical protein
MRRLATADWIALLLGALTFAVILAVLVQNFLGIE